MKTAFARFLIIAMLVGIPAAASAAGLSVAQASAIVGLLRAFGAEESIVSAVSNILMPPSADTAPDPAPVVSAPADPPPIVTYTRPSTVGSPYVSSNIGYDLSFGTTAYPQLPFGFGVVGITRGKAFVHNDRAASEYSWARFGSSVPTVYMNVNAPYGSTATSANMSAPKACGALFTGATSADGYPEPTACGAYNYGYNAAKDAYAYASGHGIPSTLWWLDIEEANSWSADTAVNDAVIQGAMDYLNTQNLRVGIYSVPFMWKNIAGDGFTPVQTLGVKAAATPTWFPIGISNQVKALNSCLTHASFIPSSPVWVIQYEADSTSVDQNIAC